jgi:hypothetical protein
MSWLGGMQSSVERGLSDAGGFIVDSAKDGAKAVASGVEDGWKSAVNDAEAAANFAATVVRTVDGAEEQVGSGIDSGETYLENKVDEGRAWLRQHGGVAGQGVSGTIGFAEGVGVSVYEAGKGLVQLADGVGSLANPIEWAANPSANIARVKSMVDTVETLRKIARLASPESWAVDPKGNARMVGALWHSAATSFDKDPAKFIGDAAGTIGMLFIPGADAAGVAGDAARGTELATDVGEAATTAGDAGNAAEEFAHRIAYRTDLPRHLAGPGGFTNKGQLKGTHNLETATKRLDAKGMTYSLKPTGAPGISELEYKYVDRKKGVITRRKTVYDPKIISDKKMLELAQKAGQKAWQQYLQNPAKTTFEASEGGIKFKVYINTDSHGKNPIVGNVHPIE